MPILWFLNHQCSTLKKRLLALSMFILVSLSSVASAESVFSARSKLPIENFSADPYSYRVVAREPGWRYIRFDLPSVPVWVSEAYVDIADGYATVSGDNLNARIEPSLDGAILLRLNMGYRSEALEMRSGFVRIKAPSFLMVAIKEPVAVSPSTIEPQVSNRESVTSRPAEPLFDGRVESQSSAATQIESSALQPAQTVPPSASASTTVRSNQHRVAPGDAISLIVFGEEDLSRDNLDVTEAGQVSFPLIGSLGVAGKTTAEIETLVQSRLSQGYVRDPKVSVSMARYRPIFIRGAVQRTGAFDYAQGLTISKAIALAGGVTSGARPKGVSIERDGLVVGDELSVDSQVAVESGDVISVDAAFGDSDGESFIYLHGEVNQPGEYRFRRGLTVEKAIVLAGGFSMRASRRKISVTRLVQGQEKPETLTKAELYMPIEPGDIIKVGASFF